MLSKTNRLVACSFTFCSHSVALLLHLALFVNVEFTVIQVVYEILHKVFVCILIIYIFLVCIIFNTLQ